MVARLIVLSVTLVCAGALIATQRWHGSFSLDTDAGEQHHHTDPTPRVGGLAIAAGLLATWFMAGDGGRAILGPMLLAAIPAFAAGLMEDITKRVSAMVRLAATFVSAFLACYLARVVMRHTGLPPLDWMLSFTPLAALFTAIAVAGVANAFNIIDGFNGLAAGTAAIMLGALSVLAWSQGDASLSTVCMVLGCVALGFGAINWPYGHIFMGDGGAYLLGFVVAWLSVLLPARNPHISGWATLLVCAYPVLEVAFSVNRRRKRRGRSATGADRAHLHHFIHRRLIRRLFPKAGARLQNGLTSPLCWLLAALPAGWAVVFHHSNPMLALGFVVAFFTYGVAYARLTQFCWCFSARTLRPSPIPVPVPVFADSTR